MSATADALSLKNFFDHGRKRDKIEENLVTILSTEGRVHPVLVHYVNGIFCYSFISCSIAMFVL